MPALPSGERGSRSPPSLSLPLAPLVYYIKGAQPVRCPRGAAHVLEVNLFRGLPRRQRAAVRGIPLRPHSPAPGDSPKTASHPLRLIPLPAKTVPDRCSSTFFVSVFDAKFRGKRTRSATDARYREFNAEEYRRALTFSKRVKMHARVHAYGLWHR